MQFKPLLFNIKNIGEYASYFKGLRELPRTEAVEFYKTLDHMAVSLGIRHPVTLWVAEKEALPNAFALFKNFKSDKPIVTLTQGMLDLANNSTKQVPSAAIRGVMGHECAHLAYDSQVMCNKNAAYIPIFALPAAAVSAVGLFDQACQNAKKKNALHKHTTLAELSPFVMQAAQENAALHSQRVDAAETSGNRKCQREETAAEHWSRFGTYMAAAVLGIGGGLVMARNRTLASEFRADRIGAQFSGDHEAFIGLLDKAQHALNVQEPMTFKAYPYCAHQTTEAMFKAFWERIKSYVSAEIYAAKVEVSTIHPPLAERKWAMREHMAKLNPAPTPAVS